MEFIGVKITKEIQNVIDIISIGGGSKETIENYVYSINRFLIFFEGRDIPSLTEGDILEYLKCNYLNKSCSSNTYNVNVAAIKFFYSVNFNKEFNNKLLPHAKIAKKLPVDIDRETFIKIFNNEKNLKHKCWLLLAYSSGLRASEIASIKISNIYSKENKIKVLGKGKKERFTVLPNFSIQYLRLFYKEHYLNSYRPRKNKTEYLFEGNGNSEHLSSNSITNYFVGIKKKYNLPKEITFHSLRHAFSTNFIKADGDPFVLKSLLGHSSLNTTSIYVHTGRKFGNLRGVNYEQI